MSKLTTIDEAVADIADGSSVGLGGWIFYGQPMALVRALIRKGARNLDLVPTPGSIAPDMLIGAGCARSTVCVFISFEQFGLAPHFRRRAEAGTLKVIDLDGPAIAGGLRAAICDVCLIHAQQADEHGNVQHLASPFFDAMLAQASRRVIVSVDRIVSSETIRRNNHLTKLPSVMVDAVLEAPWGAYPTASSGLKIAPHVHCQAGHPRRRSCARLHGDDVRSLRDTPDGRPGCRGHQDRAARRRPHPQPAAHAQRSQHLLRAAQLRQEEPGAGP